MTTLFSRDRDGGYPVHILTSLPLGGSEASSITIPPWESNLPFPNAFEGLKNRQFRVELPPERGGPVLYTSARQLLIGLTRHPKARNWTFERYFYLGRYTPALLRTAPGNGPPLTVLELLGPAPICFASPTIVTVRPRGAGQGIDLAKRGQEVAKLLFAGFGRVIAACGYDPEDVLQDVNRAILVRNRGTCPWDPGKASFGHYVHMVCQCELANYHRKMNRRREVEQVGLMGFDPEGDGELISMDVRDMARDSLEAICAPPASGTPLGQDIQKYLEHAKTDPERVQLALQALPLLTHGYTRNELAALLHTSKATLIKALLLLRKVARVLHPGQTRSAGIRNNGPLVCNSMQLDVTNCKQEPSCLHLTTS